MIVVKRITKSFSKYDETDQIKRMKDSDILAEKERKTPSYISSSVIAPTASGMAAGAAGLGLAGGLKGLVSKRSEGARLMHAGAGLKKGAIIGAIGGGLIAGGRALKKKSEERRDTDFYNDRLKFAKRQATRREKIDWRQNMTQREGYSY